MKYCSTANGYDIYVFNDPMHPMMTTFRENVCRDHDCPLEMMDMNLSHGAFKALYAEKGCTGEFEEAYKVSTIKWKDIGFVNIFAVVVDDKIVSISGDKLYNDGELLRTCMSFYTLIPYRKAVRSIMFSEHGFFKQHLGYAESMDVKSIFISVYEHNRKLVSHVANLGKRKLSMDGSAIPQYYFDRLINVGNTMLNNVPQTILLYVLDDSYVYEGIY